MDTQHKIFIIGLIALIPSIIAVNFYFPAVVLPPEEQEPLPFPIYIECESDWFDYEGLITGDGTEGDPFVIENYEIEGSYPEGCITIKNTDSHFVIKGNHLSNGYACGIYISNAWNGVICFNQIDYCEEAGIAIENEDYIYLQGSNGYNGYHTSGNHKIYNNTIEYNYIGIGCLFMCEDILIENNTVINNYVGIGLSEGMWDIVINNNTIEGCFMGIYLEFITNYGGNVISDNSIRYNLVGVYELTVYHYQFLGNIFDNFEFGIIGDYYGGQGSPEDLSYNNTYLYNRFLDPEEFCGDELPGTAKFDNGQVGNYWQSYLGSDADGDGIGDIPHEFATSQGTHYDYFPIVSLTKPLPFTLNSTATYPDPEGNFTLYWSRSCNARAYSLYWHDDFISEINSSVTLLAEGLTKRHYEINDRPMGRDYYIVLAKNGTTINTTSNCVQITVGNFPQNFNLSSDTNTSIIPDPDGNYSLRWATSNYTEGYYLYEYDGLITKINESLTLMVENTTERSFNITDRVDGKYFYIVEARNIIGNCLSNCINISVGNLPKPFDISSDAGDPDSDGNYTVSWAVSDYAINYTLYEFNKTIMEINKSLTVVLNESVNLSYNFSNKPNGKYYYLVMAKNQFGNITSDCIEVWVGRPPKAFVLSSNASFPDLDGMYNVSWTISNFTSSYTLYESSKPITGIHGGLTKVVDETTELFHILVDKPDGLYYYIVNAKNEYGEQLSNCIQVVVGVLPKPFDISSDAGDPDSDGNYTISWGASILAEAYYLYEYNNPITLINESLTLIRGNTTELSYDFSDEQNGRYYYVALAKNQFGNITSDCIEVWVGCAPGSFILSSDAGDPDDDGSFEVSWTSSEFAINYTLYIFIYPITKINNFNTTERSYAFEDLDDATYILVVVAYNEFGSTISNNITVTVSIDEKEKDEKEPQIGGLTWAEWALIGLGTGLIIAVISGLAYISNKGAINLPP